MKTVADLIALLQTLPADTEMQALTRVMEDGCEEMQFRPLEINVNVDSFMSDGRTILQLGEHPRSCREIEEEDET